MDWYRWHPTLFEADTVHLSCLEVGAYKLLIDRYMMTRQPLLDHDQALANITRLPLEQWLSVSSNLRAFFKSRGGRLHHKRCDIELDRQDRTIKKLSDAGKNSAAKRRSKANEMPTEDQTRVRTMDQTDVRTEAPTEEMRGEVEERKESPLDTPHPVGGSSAAPGDDFPERSKRRGPYAFEGRVIRVNQADFARWSESYHALADLRAELQALDDYAATNPNFAKNWFFATSGALRKKHDQCLKDSAARKAQPKTGWVAHGLG